MSIESKDKARERARRHRRRKKAEGSRLVQRWVLDTRSTEFAERARREAQAIAGSEQEADDQAFIDSVSELKFG
jgi:hypothetical protein